MNRPTIADVARAAGVGVATVDRVLNRRAPVRRETAERVLRAAEEIGYHATVLLRRRLEEAADERTLGFLIQRRTESFYQTLGTELAAATRAASTFRGRPIVEHLEDLSPGVVAARLRALGERADAVALVAADHPKVTEAVREVSERGKPVIALLSDLTAPARAGFVGIDHRKAGRTAGWAISRLARASGTIGIFVGSHRYLGHELCEISFRTYFREHAPGFTLLEPVASLEDSRLAHEGTLELLRRHPDLVAIYVAGGGMEGVIAGLREHGSFDRVVAVCNELIPETRAALIDGVIDLVIATPVRRLAENAVSVMAQLLASRTEGEMRVVLPFELYVSENI